ncbi:MAG: hypothetical protein ABIF82_12565 [Planctomycetota bacterium]
MHALAKAHWWPAGFLLVVVVSQTSIALARIKTDACVPPLK